VRFKFAQDPVRSAIRNTTVRFQSSGDHDVTVVPGEPVARCGMVWAADNKYFFVFCAFAYAGTVPVIRSSKNARLPLVLTTVCPPGRSASTFLVIPSQRHHHPA
jgi:hypothetical protein